MSDFKRVKPALVLLTFLSLLTACGGGDDPETGSLKARPHLPVKTSTAVAWGDVNAVPQPEATDAISVELASYKQRKPDLVVRGTPEEIGKAIGEAYADELKILVKEFIKKLAKDFGELMTEEGTDFYPALRETIAPPYESGIPLRYRREMVAMADAAGVDYVDLLIGNVIVEIMQLPMCSVGILADDRTATSEALFGRNLDFVTAGMLEKYSVVIEYHPNGRNSFTSATFPGLVGVLTAVNSEGVAAADLMEPSDQAQGKFITDGVPYLFLIRQALEKCSSAEAVVDHCRGASRTTSNSIAVADASGAGLVIEGGVEYFAVRRLDEGGRVCATNTFQTLERETPKCWRFEKLGESYSEDRIYSIEDIIGSLDAVAQTVDMSNSFPTGTIHTAVLLPKRRAMLLSMSGNPSTKGEFHIVTLGE